MELQANAETRLDGISLSPGVVIAPVCLFSQSMHEELPAYTPSDRGVKREKARVERAVGEVVAQLQAIGDKVLEKVGDAEAQIFKAQAMIARDPELMTMVDEVLAKGYNAESALMQVFGEYESRLIELDDEYMSLRANDVGELKRRLLDVLCDTRPSFQCASDAHCRRGNDRVVITTELAPAMSVEMETNKVLGFVTERGGEMSHAAILARALGIPAVSGIPGIAHIVPCGTEVVVDGDAGVLIVRPDEATKRDALERIRSVDRPVPVDPVDGFDVMGNISLADDVDMALEMKAEGIGLYRTEFEFFAADTLLGEDEQYERYARVVRAMDGKPVYIRLLDIGADKTAAIFELGEEENPALGLRGARLLLRRPDLLRGQSRAIVRAAAHGPVRVLYPMIVDTVQFRLLRDRFADATRDLTGGDIQHGIMLEVPSAFLDADRLLDEADFASVGTNDLVQYIFAADRNNQLIDGDYSYENEIFWNLLRRLVVMASNKNTPLSVCGEMASNPAVIPRLRALGVRSVSASSRLIPAVRRAAVSAERTV